MTLQTTGENTVDCSRSGPRTLAGLRRQAGVTQAQVSQALGVSETQVSRIEAKFPHVPFTTVQTYMKALGAHIVFTEWDLGDVFADDLIPDPARQEALRRRDADPARRPGRRSAEELPLKRDTPQASGDDPRRNEDHPHTESDQSDSGQRQQR